MLMGIFQNTVHRIHILRVLVSASRSLKIIFLVTLHLTYSFFLFPPFYLVKYTLYVLS